jgi:hypothetical protein
MSDEQTHGVCDIRPFFGLAIGRHLLICEFASPTNIICVFA